MMKKLLLLTLMIICAIAVVACNTTPPATSTPQSQPPVASSESEESIVESQPESQPESEPASDPASDPESVVESTPIVYYTITFEVAEGLTAPVAIQVEEGDVVTLPTHVGEYQVKKWINKATGEEFVGGEFTLCENVTLVAVIPAETQPY